ncbi:MAG TPA: Fic family protein [Chitinophagaceae bacterium]|nr:Fic family protein [Chitinophagaceae bacterium]
MNILTDKYFAEFKNKLSVDISSAIKVVDEIEMTPQTFTFYTSVAVISSSKIEGEKMEIDSYVKHKMQDIEYLPELVEKPNDLYKAYLFAKQNKLSIKNFLQSHVQLSEHLLPERWRGVYRKNEMVVLEHKTGRIQFEAAPFSIVETEMQNFWEDIDQLLKKKLNAEEVFYYASFIHAVFVVIHPFNDGNGRAARLLEKWFLAEHLGERAWYVKSEKYYYHHMNDYYKNLNRLGMFYEKIDYSKADPFMQMLPQSIAYKE